MADRRSLERLRPCGKLEQFSTARHDLGFYNNVGFTSSYQHPSSTVELRPLIFHALRIVIQQHPILSTIPLDENTTRPYFARLPDIDLRTCVQLLKRKTPLQSPGSNDAELDGVLSEQHSKDFKSHLGERPFWSMIVLYEHGCTTEFSASWIYHHAIADGASGLVFHRCFRAALQNCTDNILPADLNAHPIVTSPQTPLLPPLEDMHPLPLSPGYLLKQQWNDWFPPKTRGLWLGNKISFNEAVGPKRHFNSLNFSKETTIALRNISRQHGTSVTATLQCLIAAATLANVDEEKWTRLRGSGTISLRRFLSLDEDALGTWVSSYSFDHHREPSASGTDTGMPSKFDTESQVLGLFSWTDAQALKQSIASELDKNLKDNVVNLARWLSDMRHFFSKKVGSNRGESFELSNVGAVTASNMVNPDGWRIGRCVFSQSASVTGPAFMVSAVTGGDGCMVLGFSWLEDVVEEGWMGRVIRDIKKGVDGLAV